MTPEDFAAHCFQNGVNIERIEATVGLLTLSKRFQAGSNQGFTEAESDIGVIYYAPQTQAGSTWGTDGGSVGGHAAMLSGMMRMNRSGVSKRWLAKLAKCRHAQNIKTLKIPLPVFASECSESRQAFANLQPVLV